MKILKDLRYSSGHEWVKAEKGNGFIGISDHAQASLGDIVFVELPEEGQEFQKGDVLGVLESVKAASDLFIPVSGKVLKVNDKVIENPQLVNQEPYESWLVMVELSNPEELDNMMDAEEYKEFSHGEE